ncbi:hypothetical protein B0H14DRAFT_2590320 [Mycena olivaceomarginata]|nr:hypothetical protein B0H14DRAFT_2590320 [Mycena olivaceomarginata]
MPSVSLLIASIKAHCRETVLSRFATALATLVLVRLNSSSAHCAALPLNIKSAFPEMYERNGFGADQTCTRRVDNRGMIWICLHLSRCRTVIARPLVNPVLLLDEGRARPVDGGSLKERDAAGEIKPGSGGRQTLSRWINRVRLAVDVSQCQTDSADGAAECNAGPRAEWNRRLLAKVCRRVPHGRHELPSARTFLGALVLLGSGEKPVFLTWLVQKLSGCCQVPQDRSGQDGTSSILSKGSYVPITTRHLLGLRPQNVRYKKARPIAASSLDHIWGKYSSLFFCPHRHRSGQAYDPLILSLGACHEGGLADIYRVLDHVCSFVTFEAEKERGDDGDGDGDDTLPSSDPSSSLSTGYQLSSLQTSMLSVTSLGPSPAKSKSTSTSAIDKLVAEAMLCPNPRYTGPWSMSTGRRAPPHSIPTRLGTVLDRTVRSYYSHGVADAQKFSNMGLMSYIQEITAFCTISGQYQHPSAVLVQTVGPSNPGHEFGPGHPVRRLRNLCLIISDMNTIGAIVSVPTTQTLFQSKHVHCLKGPSASGRSATSVLNSGAKLIGTALLQWNSHLGIPTDVWITASTAVVHCTLCDLTHSFPAHVLHLDGEDCSDPGQAIVSANEFDSDL